MEFYLNTMYLHIPSCSELEKKNFQQQQQQKK